MLDRKLRSGATIADIVLWLATTERPIQRNALSRHANAHLGVVRTPGPLPPSGSFLEAVRDTAHADLQAGVLRPTLTHGIAAEAELNRQKSRSVDQDIMLKIAMMLGGHLPPGTVRVIDPEVEAIEAEFRPLLEAGTE
jgi:hypothetical protein